MSECPVCFESLRPRITTVFPCSHAVCLNCLVRLRPPQRCPLCRRNLTPLIPVTPTPQAVTLNIRTRDPEDVTMSSYRRRITQRLALAVGMGAAPRNRPPRNLPPVRRTPIVDLTQDSDDN